MLLDWLNFNSYMVRLRVVLAVTTPDLNSNFNSYMVRLRAFNVWTCQRYFFWFQFLHGAIKGSVAPLQSRCCSSHFNSYMVRLRVCQLWYCFYDMFHFNSYMVRLRVESITLADVVIRFQFLHGAIKGTVCLKHSYQDDAISIPTWCD